MIERLMMLLVGGGVMVLMMGGMEVRGGGMEVPAFGEGVSYIEWLRGIVENREAGAVLVNDVGAVLDKVFPDPNDRNVRKKLKEFEKEPRWWKAEEETTLAAYLASVERLPDAYLWQEVPKLYYDIDDSTEWIYEVELPHVGGIHKLFRVLLASACQEGGVTVLPDYDFPRRVELCVQYSLFLMNDFFLLSLKASLDKRDMVYQYIEFFLNEERLSAADRKALYSILDGLGDAALWNRLEYVLCTEQACSCDWLASVSRRKGLFGKGWVFDRGDLEDLLDLCGMPREDAKKIIAREKPDELALMIERFYEESRAAIWDEIKGKIVDKLDKSYSRLAYFESFPLIDYYYFMGKKIKKSEAWRQELMEKLMGEQGGD